MSVVPKQRREGQNTGLRAKTVRAVESQECPGGGLHVLVNDAAAVTTCAGCGVGWAVIDARINVRSGWKD